jgi:hypothetical protein
MFDIGPICHVETSSSRPPTTLICALDETRIDESRFNHMMRKCPPLSPVSAKTAVLPRPYDGGYWYCHW